MDFELTLPSAVYTQELIHKTCSSLSQLTRFKIEEKKEGYAVMLSMAQNDDLVLREFNNLLIRELNTSIIQNENHKMRSAIIAEALALQNNYQGNSQGDDLNASLAELESDALEDPLGLSEPWQNKQ